MSLDLKTTEPGLRRDALKLRLAKRLRQRSQTVGAADVGVHEAPAEQRKEMVRESVALEVAHDQGASSPLAHVIQKRGGLLLGEMMQEVAAGDEIKGSWAHGRAKRIGAEKMQLRSRGKLAAE